MRLKEALLRIIIMMRPISATNEIQGKIVKDEVCLKKEEKWRSKKSTDGSDVLSI